MRIRETHAQTLDERVNSDSENRETTSRQRDVPWWMKTPSYRSLFAYCIVVSLVWRPIGPAISDSLGMSGGQFTLLLIAVLPIVLVCVFLLDRWLKKKYGLSTSSKRRAFAESDPSPSAAAATEATKPGKRTVRQP
ncbi:hypothetical protein [Candidatus Poriferisodalis sp.]|uniref:hypothetical protein n=1 Tax=Candidatus Poriferisodalis sp. TaxID=3101277 RepID=UPI003C6F5733